MFTGLTKQEQIVLLILVTVIAGGLGMNYLQQQKNHEVVYVKKGIATVVDDAGSSQQGPDRKGWAIQNEATVEQKNPIALAGQTSQPPQKTDINQATVEDLAAIRGIGPSRAEAIVRHRQTIGGFKSIDRMDDVPGVGKKTIEIIRANFYVQETPAPPEKPAMTPASSSGSVPVSTNEKKHSGVVNINTATLDELCELDGIGPTLAERIAEYRRTHGGFKTPQEIKEVHGIGEKKFQANKHRITVR